MNQPPPELVRAAFSLSEPIKARFDELAKIPGLEAKELAIRLLETPPSSSQQACRFLACRELLPKMPNVLVQSSVEVRIHGFALGQFDVLYEE